MRVPFDPASGARALALAAFLGLVSCKSDSSARYTDQTNPPAPPTKTEAKVSSELTAKADVVAIDKETRCVALRAEDGRLVEVRCGPDVRNFDRISVGDALRVRYGVSLTASLRPSDEKIGPIVGAATAARAKRGEKPGAVAGAGISLRVRIESVDVPRDIVVFSPGSGDLIAHRIATSEGREFVKGLKVGDIVRLDYTEAVALSVEPQP